MKNILSALEHCLIQHPDLLDRVNSALVLRAVPGHYLHSLKKVPIFCLQSYKPIAEALCSLGFSTETEPTESVSLALVFADKHKQEVLYHFAYAAEKLEEGGLLLVVAENALGARSLEKHCAEAFGHVHSHSKQQCRVFWARKDSSSLNQVQLKKWLQGGKLQWLPDIGLYSRPGLFSWKNIDPGSRLLAEQLPHDLSGRGADFGSGYGYLSKSVLARSSRVSELHLFDAEKKALEAAERNLAEESKTTTIQYHWWDITAPVPMEKYRFVVMNPPFHHGHESVPAIGQAFIRTACHALVNRGVLFLVANRHLPYEKIIKAQSVHVERVSERDGFKVIQAIKS